MNEADSYKVKVVDSDGRALESMVQQGTMVKFKPIADVIEFVKQKSRSNSLSENCFKRKKSTQNSSPIEKIAVENMDIVSSENDPSAQYYANLLILVIILLVCCLYLVL